MDRMHIAYLFNNDMFAEMACVSMCSLLENRGKESKIVFHLFAADITRECVDKINEIHSHYSNIEILFLDYFVDENLGKYAVAPKGMPSWPKDVFVKVLLPELLPNVDRLLFLDCDTVIEDDIAVLWRFDLGDALVGMTTNSWTEAREITEAKIKALEVKQNDFFSVGVMIMNLEGLRELRLSSIVAENVERLHENVMKAGLLWLPEMDCLNYALDGKIKRLPVKYNCNFWMTRVFEDSFDDCLESLSKPVIIHFLDKPKPSELGIAPILNPEWERYHKYKAMSPFAVNGDTAKVAIYKQRESRTLDALKPYIDANIVRWYCHYFSRQMFELALKKYESTANGKRIVIWGLNEKTWTLVLFLAAHGLKIKCIVDGLEINQGIAVFDYVVKSPEVLKGETSDMFIMIDMRDYGIARQVMADLHSWRYSTKDYYHVYSPIWEGTEGESGNIVPALYGAGSSMCERVANPYQEKLVYGLEETDIREDENLAVTDICIENGGGAKFYSSCGEDALLLRLFVNSYRKSIIKDGVYVDVGAHHPNYASNTHVLYKLGWTGINIEANPHAISSFERERPKDVNLSYAVSKANEEISFYLFGEEGAELYGSSSTTDAKFKENIEKEQNLVSKGITVQGKRLDDILSMHLRGTQIDFMNIDVENKELEVLESNDWTKYRPLVIAVEILPKPNGAFETRNTLNSSPTISFLEKRGYICFSQTLYTWFFYDVRNEKKYIVENWTKWYSREGAAEDVQITAADFPTAGGGG